MSIQTGETYFSHIGFAMKTTDICRILLLLCGISLFFCENAVFAQPGFLKNIGKSVEADPKKEYLLSEVNGPWLIHVTAFNGPNGRKEANELIYDLRKNHKFKAYLYEQKFVNDLRQEGNRPQSAYSRPLKYLKTGTSVEYAVVIGDFQSPEDQNFQKTLQAVKQCRPECLMKKQTSMNYAAWRGGMSRQTDRGPLYMSFGITNPKLPPESKRGTVDKFIESINAQRPYSLLNCPNRYTVQVATFTGKVVIKPDEIKEIEGGRKPFSVRKVSELEMGEQAAVKLCRILRDEGFEAYEFHDRYASIVTVGSFNDIGQKLPNGMVNYHPGITAIINRFQGSVATQGALTSYEPVRFDDIECDIQPRIIEVPRKRSI